MAAEDAPVLVPLRDIEVGYRVSGRELGGTPLVFVHGLGEDSRSWSEQQRDLGRDHRTYAVDVRGHGVSELGAANGTLDQLSDDLVMFLESVAGPSVCIGFSMGGAIALAAAARRPALVSGVVCVCSSSTVGSAAAERFRTRAAGIKEQGRPFAADALRQNLSVSVVNPPADMADQVAVRLDAIGDGLGYANGALAMASMRENPLTTQLGRIECHVDVLVGELDESCPWRAGQMIVDAVPDGGSHWLPDVGHFVNIERPAVLTAALRELPL